MFRSQTGADSLFPFLLRHFPNISSLNSLIVPVRILLKSVATHCMNHIKINDFSFFQITIRIRNETLLFQLAYIGHEVVPFIPKQIFRDSLGMYLFIFCQTCLWYQRLDEPKEPLSLCVLSVNFSTSLSVGLVICEKLSGGNLVPFSISTNLAEKLKIVVGINDSNINICKSKRNART